MNKFDEPSTPLALPAVEPMPTDMSVCATKID
jgi:hypothetical protein